MTVISTSDSAGLPGAGSLADKFILDAFPLAAYVCEAKGHIVAFNEKAVELWGLPPGRGAQGPA